MAIKELKNGRYQVDYSQTVHKADGTRKVKRRRESFDTFEDADCRQAEIRRLRKRGHLSEPVKYSLRFLVQDYEKYLKIKGRSPNYLIRVQTSKNALFPFFDFPVSSLTPEIIQDYILLRQQLGKSNQTIRNELGLLRATLNRKRRNINDFKNESIPFLNFEMPGVEHKIPELPEPKIFQKIFNNLSGQSEEDTLNTKKLFYFLFATGSRFGETIALTADDVKNGQIHFYKKTKRKLERWVDLPKLPFKLPEKGLLFVRNSKPWREWTLLSRIRKACDKVGTPWIRIHDLRRGAATFRLASGENPYSVMQNLGWRDFKMMQEHYINFARQYKFKGSYLPKWR